jgi:hypothetical protein
MLTLGVLGADLSESLATGVDLPLGESLPPRTDRFEDDLIASRSLLEMGVEHSVMSIFTAGLGKAAGSFAVLITGRSTYAEAPFASFEVVAIGLGADAAVLKDSASDSSGFVFLPAPGFFFLLPLLWLTGLFNKVLSATLAS